MIRELLQAGVFMAPVILEPWGPWWGVLTIWLVVTFMAHRHGLWACRRNERTARR